ncbi:hypothetical protein HELRODRAFT_183795 [Helobdella robusta]|uniref:RGS domain-containing protein n=1 Tax=Helobdella robusta TaxID=6412 RepID=T1FK73_HELRO|nr:hypothetical protein HELRODRAFT_183795 [Helobdella robusta]ESO10270.1 hypothetical protein HELRODRAFT_183795 [Helobdella robusta]
MGKSFVINAIKYLNCSRSGFVEVDGRQCLERIRHEKEEEEEEEEEKEEGEENINVKTLSCKQCRTHVRAAGRQIFTEFLRSEYSEENMLFWLACEELRQESNPVMIEEKARVIYDDYISILSPKEAQLQIFTLMKRDSYPRFLASNLFKQLLQKNNVPQQQQHQHQTSSSNIQLHPPQPTTNATTTLVANSLSS